MVVSVKFRTFGDRQCRRKVLIFGLGWTADGVLAAVLKRHEYIAGGVQGEELLPFVTLVIRV